MIIIGHHGTSKATADALMAGAATFEQFRLSTNSGDWLGLGAYFWQDAPQRAFVWARRVLGLPQDQIGVVEADIDLDGCLDFYDLQTYRDFRKAYGRFLEFETLEDFAWSQEELRVDGGHAYVGANYDPTRTVLVENHRDRAFIDWYVRELDKRNNRIKSVRGVFLSGNAVYQESFLFDWSHAQIAVRDLSLIKNLRLVI